MVAATEAFMAKPATAPPAPASDPPDPVLAVLEADPVLRDVTKLAAQIAADLAARDLGQMYHATITGRTSIAVAGPRAAWHVGRGSLPPIFAITLNGRQLTRCAGPTEVVQAVRDLIATELAGMVPHSAEAAA